MSNSSKISDEMARYIVRNEPIPEDLASALIGELCKEYGQEKREKRVKTVYSTDDLERDK